MIGFSSMVLIVILIATMHQTQFILIIKYIKMKNIFIKAVQFVLIIAMLSLIIMLFGTGCYLIYKTFSWIVIKFILGVASLTISLFVVNKIAVELDG